MLSSTTKCRKNILKKETAFAIIKDSLCNRLHLFFHKAGRRLKTLQNGDSHDNI